MIVVFHGRRVLAVTAPRQFQSCKLIVDQSILMFKFSCKVPQALYAFILIQVLMMLINRYDCPFKCDGKNSTHLR